MNVGEIAIVLAYIIATNFLESLFILCAPLFLSMLLPLKWFRDLFVARGASLAFLGLGYMMFIAYRYNSRNGYPSILLKAWSIALAAGIIALLIFMAGKIPLVKKMVEAIAERSTIFLYIYVPLSIISCLVVLYRLI
jgi:hypothetical protein